MKRDPALVSLSHGHHQALFVAQKLRRAEPATVGEARASLAAFWPLQGLAHFRLEEEVLLPAFAGHGNPHHPLVAQVLCDHIDLRHRADRLLEPDHEPSVEELHAFGERLAAHVRLEERELFPLIEQAMPAPALTVVASALEQAEALLERR